MINKGRKKWKKGQELGIGAEWIADPVTLATHADYFEIVADRHGAAVKTNKDSKFGSQTFSTKRKFNAELKRIKKECSQQNMDSNWNALFDGKLELIIIIDYTQEN